jgi:hypothetical protein
MSLGSSFKKLIGSLAPTIGAALGGPMGGVAMKFLADRFTGGDTGKVEDFLLSADPKTLKELKVAELSFAKSMRELDIDVERIAQADRASARDMAKARGFVPQIIMSSLYSAGYFAVLWAFMGGFLEVQDAHTSMFNGLLGVLSAAQIQIINFWFGSSAGSKSKSDAMAAAARPT